MWKQEDLSSSMCGQVASARTTSCHHGDLEEDEAIQKKAGEELTTRQNVVNGSKSSLTEPNYCFRSVILGGVTIFGCSYEFYLVSVSFD